MKALKVKDRRRQRRKAQIRKKVVGTGARPRLVVFRSLKHMYAQVIDDAKGATLVSMSTLDAPVKGEVACGGNRAAAARVGAALARAALAKGISTVVFDRNGCKFHGRIKALADAAREAGLKF